VLGVRGGQRAWRSPWNVGLGAVVCALAAVALVRAVLVSESVERVLDLAFAVAATVAGVRALRLGVIATPTEVVIRELTRTTRIPWTRVAGVTWRPLARRGAHAPVLRLAPERAVRGGRRGRAAETALTLQGIASYGEATARIRAEQIDNARAAALAGQRDRG
jgi:hypothetical protein